MDHHVFDTATRRRGSHRNVPKARRGPAIGCLPQELRFVCVMARFADTSEPVATAVVANHGEEPRPTLSSHCGVTTMTLACQSSGSRLIGSLRSRGAGGHADTRHG
jgi:hypothetical protein